jgi:hypothetical protein
VKKEDISKLILLCLFYQAVFPEFPKFIVCIFNEIVVSKWPSRDLMQNSGLMEGSLEETVAGDWGLSNFLN